MEKSPKPLQQPALLLTFLKKPPKQDTCRLCLGFKFCLPIGYTEQESDLNSACPETAIKL